MSDQYSPTKIHICSARGNGKSTIAVKLCEAVVRADVFHWINHRTKEVHFYSRNEEKPLTTEEKELIEGTLRNKMIPYKIVFDN